MSSGWISVYRKIQEHWLWTEKPFSKGQAWVDLLLSANHEDKKIIFDNAIVEVKAGSFITSTQRLADRWGWGKEKVLNFLKILEADGMLHKTSDHRKTTIFIDNYAIYQGSPNHRPDQSPTSGRPVTDPNNNDNKDNNIFTSLSIEEVDAFCEEKGLKIDSLKFLSYYQKNNGLDKNGLPITNWKAAAIYWSLTERRTPKNEGKEPPSFDLDKLEKQMMESPDVW